jgi:purine-binding chemotaxis protein CheW
VRHVVFRLEKDRYALPLQAIREVVPTPTQFSRVPRAPRSVRGVINLRGRVVTVVSLRHLLELGSNEETPQARVLLLDRGRRELGLLVTDVESIESIENIGPVPGRAAPGVKGVARLGALAVTVLDADGLDSAVAAAFGNR